MSENPQKPDEPRDSMEAVYDVYARGLDLSLLRENLKLSVDERIRKAERIHASLLSCRGRAKSDRKDDQ